MVVQDSFIAGVADAAGTTADMVVINSVSETTVRRRALLAKAVEVDFSVQTESAAAATALVTSDKLSLESLNSALAAQGVAQITQVTMPPAVVSPDDPDSPDPPCSAEEEVEATKCVEAKLSQMMTGSAGSASDLDATCALLEVSLKCLPECACKDSTFMTSVEEQWSAASCTGAMPVCGESKDEEKDEGEDGDEAEVPTTTVPVVQMVAELPYNKEEFMEVQDQFIAGVADAADTTTDKVVINSVSETTVRRRALLASHLAKAVEVDFSVQTESEAAATELVNSKKLSLESLNSALAAQDLKPISRITKEAEVIAPIEAPSAGWTLTITSGLALSTLALQLAAY